MHELRLNLITREWVVISRKHNRRPEDFIARSKKKARHPEFLETCPFCPGNEAITPDEKFSVRDEKGWKLRVIPNKFSVLTAEGDKTWTNTGLRKSVDGVGIHEVVIESPIHNLSAATMSAEQLQKVIEVYKERFLEIYNDQRVEHVIIFKNHGPASGTSILHPHAQIVGVPVTPLQVRYRIENAMRFFDETGECLQCKTIKDELSDGARILFNTRRFISFVPYAALSPFHIWIFPKRHSGSFADVTSEEIMDLAFILKATMSSLYYGLEDPDFNFVIRSGKPGQAHSEFVHWYLSIVPRVSITSGFELGSGMYINPLTPEMSAEFLRNVKKPE